MDDGDALFLLPPEEFVAARDELAARLRSSGEAEQAKAVKALRRPTLAAWAVNAAVRRAPDQLAELLALRTALVKAQRQVLSGVKADLAGLTRQRRQLVEGMVAQAEAALAEAGREIGPHREEVRLTFEAAVADEEAAEAVRAGRLSKALPAPAGFGTLAGLSAVPATPPRGADAARDAPDPGERSGAPADQPGDGEEPAGEDGGAAAEGAAADEAAAAAAAQLAEARGLRDKVAAAAETALAHARELKREAGRLREEADLAEAESGRRAREAEAARVRAAQAESAAERAREAADTADGRARRAREQAERIQLQLQQADELIESMQQPS